MAYTRKKTLLILSSVAALLVFYMLGSKFDLQNGPGVGKANADDAPSDPVTTTTGDGDAGCCDGSCGGGE